MTAFYIDGFSVRHYSERAARVVTVIECPAVPYETAEERAARVALLCAYMNALHASRV